MNSDIQFDLPKNISNYIKVIGVGGGGCNAVNFMHNEGIKGVDYVVCNTDAQALENSPIPNKIQLGVTLTEGLGAGANPDIGEKAALESIEDIQRTLEGNTQMVFITAGMGGGTGTGAAPIIAKASMDCGALTVAVVTKPFSFEGKKRWNRATKGIQYLTNFVDSLVIVPNDRLIDSSEKNTTMIEAFSMADDVLRQGVQGISDLISEYGIVNVDFADVKTIMEGRGVAHMGVGIGTGDNKIEDAVRNAIESPLLETSIDGARSILLYVCGGYDMGMQDISKIASKIQDEADPEANIIFGATVNENMNDKVSITLIATDFTTGGLAPAGETPEVARPSVKGTRVNVDGLEGQIVDMSDFMKDDNQADKGSSDFDVPDFLK